MLQISFSDFSALFLCLTKTLYLLFVSELFLNCHIGNFNLIWLTRKPKVMLFLQASFFLLNHAPRASSKSSVYRLSEIS